MYHTQKISSHALNLGKIRQFLNLRLMSILKPPWIVEFDENLTELLKVKDNTLLSAFLLNKK